MIFVEGLDESGRVELIADMDKADILYEFGPKFCLSSLSLMWRLMKSDRQGSELVGTQVSRSFLQKTAAALAKDASMHTHHPLTPPDSPGYVEFGFPKNATTIRHVAVTLTDFLVNQDPPLSPTESQENHP